MHLSFLTFSVFLTIFQVLKCAFLIFHVFQFFRHISSPTVLFFPSFPGFFTIFQVLLVHFSSFVFQFYLHIPGPTVCIFHFPRFSVFLAIFQTYSLSFSFSTFFQCLLQYSRSYSVLFSFSKFFSFLAIFQVQECAFLIFHVFQ